MKKRSRKGSMITLVLILLFSSVISVSATENTAEQKEKGSITIQLEEGERGTSKEGVAFAYQKVADIVNGEFELTEPFKQSNVDLNDLEYAKDLEKAAETLLAYAPDTKKKVQTNQQGIAMIENLDTGVYLLWNTGQYSYEIITPALVSVPKWDEDETQMQYDITVIPKHSPKPSETPQTGDDNQIWLYGGLVVIAGTVLVALILKIKREHK